MLAKIFSLCLAIMYAITPYVAPSTETPIDVLDENTVKLTFAAWADPQISNYILEREAVIRGAGDDLANSSVDIDALLIAGDIAENGLQCEFDNVASHIADAPVSNYIMATGNHDVRLRLYKQSVSRFCNFANDLNESVGSDLSIDALHYSYEINGYTFAVMGTDKTEMEEAYISPEQLEWLDKTLDAASGDGKPVFVVLHQILKNTHGLPLTWGNGTNTKAGSVGEQSDEIQAILNKYENIILISGHMHTGFGEYTYQKIDNFHSVNLPSICIKNKDGTYNGPGIGYMVEVYDDTVKFRARDFDDGRYVPEYDITINLSR